jgi:phosphatidylinositol glycan class N
VCTADSVVASLSIPFLHALDPISHYLHRLLIIFLAFAPTFIILTISYEALFYVAFCIMMLTWVRLEHLISTNTPETTTIQPQDPAKPLSKKAKKAAAEAAATKSTEKGSLYRSLVISDARPSLFTLYLLQSAFFSTGNIASISSFSLDAVTRLIPVFEPFSQTALVLYKILIPFVFLSAAMGILNKRLGFAPGALFMGLIVFGDWLTINFFWMVRDEGSWLEIGETISRFIIVSCLCVFAAGLESGSGWLIGGVDDGESLLLEKTSNGSVKHGEKVNGHDR